MRKKCYKIEKVGCKIKNNLQWYRKPTKFNRLLKLSRAIRDFNKAVSAKAIYQNKQHICIYMYYLLYACLAIYQKD